MMPTLFNPDKIDPAPPRFAEPVYARMNRLPDAHLVACRADLEDWFTRYPLKEQPELVSRFRNRDDRNHLSAFFELYLHELLIQQGCTVEIHPGVGGTTKLPDFGVTDGAGNCFYLEAILATDESEEEYKARAIADQVYDYINANLTNPDFSLWLTIHGIPKSLPSRRKLVAFLKEKLEGADYEEVAAAYVAKKYDEVPVWEYHHDGWTVEFRPLSKKPDRRGSVDRRIIGIWSNGISATGAAIPIEPEAVIRKALKTKSTRYRQLDRPYIVAINALSIYADRRDNEWALFGNESLWITPAAAPEETNTFTWTRSRNGSWHNLYGTIFSRVSGVLIVKGVRPQDYQTNDAVLYENPAATRPIGMILPDLTHARVDNDQLVYTDAAEVGEEALGPSEAEA